MILTYRYRIKDRSAKKALLGYAFGVNQVWNYCNAVQRDIEDRYRAGAPKRKWPGHFALTYMTSGTSKELGILADTIGAVCRQYAKSRDEAKRSLRFRASGGPKRSLGWVPFRKDGCQVAGNSITYLGKSFRVFGYRRRPLPLIYKSGAFVEDARGRWYACFQIEMAESKSIATARIGIDLGLKTLATLSNGSAVPAIQNFRRHEQALAKAQRANNKRRVRNICAKIANSRRDQHHKATSKIVSENSLIVVGNISSSKMAKTRMAKSVLDAGWSSFKNMLSYKAQKGGVVFIEVDERFTSQTCSCCGTIPDSSPKGRSALGIRRWECSDCGASHDRDVNAARNILRVGQSALPQADESGMAVCRPDKRDVKGIGGGGKRG